MRLQVIKLWGMVIWVALKGDIRISKEFASEIKYSYVSEEHDYVVVK